MLTVYVLANVDEFLAAIRRPGHRPASTKRWASDPYSVVLQRILVTHMLTALGFEGSEAVSGSADGGVDAKGVVEIANLPSVRIYVLAKRCALGRKVNSSEIKKLRGMIPMGGQGALITTGEFKKDAHEIASEPGFAPVGLVNGRQLVDLLVEHWNDIPVEVRAQLGLRPGLVPVQ